jgi:hypothetical protein
MQSYSIYHLFYLDLLLRRRTLHTHTLPLHHFDYPEYQIISQRVLRVGLLVLRLLFFEVLGQKQVLDSSFALS